MLPYPPTARYALSGTDIAYVDIALRARYALSGTDLAYGANCFAIGLGARYALSGTDLACGTTRIVTVQTVLSSGTAWCLR
eukprot:1317728-Rhodomonas_salina.4